MWAPPSHHEVNVKAGVLLATPEGVLCTLGGVCAGCQCPGLKPRKDSRLLQFSSLLLEFQISEFKSTPRSEQLQPCNAPVSVHLGASVCAHTREPWSLVRPLVAALVATLAVLGRLRERHMKDFIECEDREQRQKAEGGGCSLCSRGGMRKC